MITPKHQHRKFHITNTLHTTGLERRTNQSTRDMVLQQTAETQIQKITSARYQGEQTLHRMPFNAEHQHVHTALNIREQACHGRSRQHPPAEVKTVLVSCPCVAFTQKRRLLEKPPFVRKLLANQSDRDVHGATELTMIPRSVKHMPRSSPSELRTSQDLPILTGRRVTTTKARCDGTQNYDGGLADRASVSGTHGSPNHGHPGDKDQKHI